MPTRPKTVQHTQTSLVKRISDLNRQINRPLQDVHDTENPATQPGVQGLENAVSEPGARILEAPAHSEPGARSLDSLWIAVERLCGIDLCFVVDRRAPPADAFYRFRTLRGWHVTLRKCKPNGDMSVMTEAEARRFFPVHCYKIWCSIVPDVVRLFETALDFNPSLLTFVLYGKMVGGDDRIGYVRGELKYDRGVNFCAYDLAFVEHGYMRMRFLPYYSTMALFKTIGFVNYARPVAVGDLARLLDMDADRTSAYSSIEDDARIPGLLVRPFRWERVLPTGHRCAVAKKNARFLRSSPGSSPDARNVSAALRKGLVASVAREQDRLPTAEEVVRRAMREVGVEQLPRRDIDVLHRKALRVVDKTLGSSWKAYDLAKKARAMVAELVAKKLDTKEAIVAVVDGVMKDLSDELTALDNPAGDARAVRRRAMEAAFQTKTTME